MLILYTLVSTSDGKWLTNWKLFHKIENELKTILVDKSVWNYQFRHRNNEQ